MAAHIELIVSIVSFEGAENTSQNTDVLFSGDKKMRSPVYNNRKNNTL